MAKADDNKKTGVDKAPVLTEDKSADNKSEKEVTNKITPEEIAELQVKNAELEKSDQEKDTKIADLEDSIKEKDGIIEEQKTKIDQLNKSIVDFGALYSKGKEVELPKEGEVVIRFLLSPAGRYKLPYNVGQEVALHKEVAAEIVEARYAEYVLEEE
ncbi:hypothetical protein ACPDHD_11935 [Myroides odoratimimus]|uniref:hypothetical protein n=1 Tax=Myroides odoratimimus TaxID=76832 RepID=UPI00257574EF|nr:hypothetical protein [Myroides odoratimimus]MDM1325909.1 hypothetical protein [Myroides odoratimimus]MDM1452186.1 hypothetical protein [Myroides odoratimimus]MDM1475475.1 hypothetical protein [Myroides odoratimimus]MDM1488238.1 hypothetical protein [Myroides odoratimimus]